MIVFINAVIAINLLTQNQPTMSKDKKEKQKLESLKTTRKINNNWTIDFRNTSDIGYPDDEYYLTIGKED